MGWGGGLLGILLEGTAFSKASSVSEYSLRPTMYIMHIVPWYD